MLRFEVINDEQMDSYVKNKRALIIDVREPEDYEKKHIETIFAKRGLQMKKVVI